MTNTNAQRAKVFHGNLDKTTGGLTKKDLMKNAQGKIVSRKASNAAKKNNNLGNFKQNKNSNKFELSPKKGSKAYKELMNKKSNKKSKKKSAKKSMKKSAKKSMKKSAKKSAKKSKKKSAKKSKKKSKKKSAKKSNK